MFSCGCEPCDTGCNCHCHCAGENCEKFGCLGEFHKKIKKESECNSFEDYARSVTICR